MSSLEAKANSMIKKFRTDNVRESISALKDNASNGPFMKTWESLQGGECIALFIDNKLFGTGLACAYIDLNNIDEENLSDDEVDTILYAYALDDEPLDLDYFYEIYEDDCAFCDAEGSDFAEEFFAHLNELVELIKPYQKTIIQKP